MRIKVMTGLKGAKALRTAGGVLALLLLLSLSPAPALAVPPPGHYFYGNAAGASPGTVVTANIVGTALEYNATVDASGQYGYGDPDYMIVVGDDPDTPEKDGGAAGDDVEFYVGGIKALLYDVDAGEWLDIYPWESGGTTNLDLITMEEGLDFGDAPDPTYPTLLASNGARHVIVSGFFLGAGVDAEPDGQPDATATGDDLDGNDDEDGIVFTSLLAPGQVASVDVTASASGLLNAWMDFNADGDWFDAGEQIFLDQALVAGVNSLTFPVPAGAAIGQTIARFRFSTVSGLSFEGLAPDGEVEDYMVMLAPPIDVDLSKVLVEPPEGPAFVGDPIQFRVVVRNTGQTAFVSNPFTDTFEACMSFVSAEQDGVPVDGIGPDSPLTWDLVTVNGGAIVPGQVVVIDLYFQVDVPGTCLNQASVVEYDEYEQEASDSDEAPVDIASLDFGDAPDPLYPTLLASNGARHVIVSGFFLGASVDAEADGQPDATATGDDNAGVPDDEDGVVFTSGLVPGQVASVDVTASASGLLNAWMDFNADGDWADAGEQIFLDQTLVAGVNSLTFPVPAGAAIGQTIARFRFSTVSGLSFEGLAPDGEVEDYVVTLAPPIGVDLSKALVEPLEGSAFVGDPIQFQVVVTNTGETAFVSNPFTDTFEACMSFVSAEQDGVPVDGIGPDSPLTWDLVTINGGPIVPGQVVVINLYFQADVPGTCLNQASVVEYDEYEQEASDSDEASVNIVSLDFGDAPDPTYPTFLASNGARHIIVSGLYLGAGVDAEADGQPNATATGDDLTGTDDEDGVVFTSALVPGQAASVDVTASASGLLNAWMDFNADGDWADAGEQIFLDQALVAGVNSLTFPVPAGAALGQTIARFRFSTVSGLSFEGLAPDGEVEDYQLEVGEVPSEFTASLGDGWNLLSTPVTLDASSDTLEQIFTTETLPNLEVIYGWDAETEQWVGPLSGSYQLLPLDAIFVKLAEGTTGTALFIPSDLLTFPPSRDLVAGLNLIGPAPAFDGLVFPDAPLDQALVSIEEAPGGLTGYTMVVSPGLNQPGWAYALGGVVRDLLAYKGYWVVMENPDTLWGSSTTPIAP